MAPNCCFPKYGRENSAVEVSKIVNIRICWEEHELINEKKGNLSKFDGHQGNTDLPGLIRNSSCLGSQYKCLENHNYFLLENWLYSLP